MKDLIKRTLKTQIDLLLKIHIESKAYEEFLKHLNDNPEISDLLNTEEIEELFPKPISINSNEIIEQNESGDYFTGTEYTDISFNKLPISNITDFGWLSDNRLRNEILNNEYYKNTVLPTIGNMPKDVKDEIELHSSHILGRCNNPNDWGENKQGLVYGMVQSGKTVSMITLMGQAMSAGYRIFIVLAGDKTSLRKQTQKRINEAFDLNYMGYSNNPIKKIRSLTNLNNDYSDVSKNLPNGSTLWDIKGTDETIIICIKKQTDNLKKLLLHLKEIKQNCAVGGQLNHIIDFDKDFKTMIIDDEADYASQDTKPNTGGATIHNNIVQIRKELPQNCYVAYTATPQACIGANPDKEVGYPSDFIWLLEPFRDDYGETTTYLGLEEFFEKFPNELIERLPKGAWPHYIKDDKKNRGVYNPKTGQIEKVVLTLKEIEFVNELIKNKNDRDKYCKEYKNAIVNFLITCGIRWHRHYIKMKNEGFFKDFPTEKNIEAIERIGEKNTPEGFIPFPYHAMMFNLTYITDSQKKVLELVKILWEDVKKDWTKTKSNWKNETLFTKQFEIQKDKSFRFSKPSIDNLDLSPFIDYAINITSKNIESKDSFIYLLNSDDEGLDLQYDNPLPEGRPKKASIIVGGNILSRGLTIENLSVTVFARSQVMSLGDTNLQMCRWFGHKRKEIDLQTVYLQDHSQFLFQTISEADNELRSQFKYHIFNSIKNECLILSLFSSPLFRVTSPSKSKFLESGTQTSYSGITVDMLQPLEHVEFEKNNKLLDGFINSIRSNSIVEKDKFKRADVYKNVPKELFYSFFKSLKYSDTALNVTPIKYIDYLKKWHELGIPMPEFNVAIFDADLKTRKGRNRARKTIGLKCDFKNEADLKKATLKTFAPFRGGKSDPNAVKSNESNSYCGDNFIDFPLTYHIENYKKTNLRRPKNSPILFIFYKLNPNYIGQFKLPDSSKNIKVEFVDGDDGYIKTNEYLVTFSIATPLGGPIYKTQNNKFKNFEKLNSKECEDFFDKLNSIENGK